MTRAQGKDREKTGNLVLIRAWQPCTLSFVTVTATNFAVTGESLCDRFRGNVATMS